MKRGRAHLLRSTLMIMLSAFMISTVKFDSRAAGTTTFRVTGNFNQTSARDMLSTINQLRTGGNAWIYDKYNNKENLGAMGALEIDPNLEEVAMQRALEISVRYGHDRPDGNDCFTCSYKGTKSFGENILASSGNVTTAQAYNMWLEENDDYEGQGHRRNMLRSGYTAIGIAHVERYGCHFWVQEFGYSKSGASLTNALNGARTSDVVVDNNYLNSYLIDGDGRRAVEVMYGNSYDLGVITEHISAGSVSFEPPLSTSKPTGFTISDSAVASISRNTLTGKRVGNAVLSAVSASGRTITMPVKVVPCRISYASVTFDKYEYAYTGEAIIPGITVTYSGLPLTEGVDYTVDLRNNTNKGFATAKISGKGNFSGTITRLFYITDRNGNAQRPSRETGTDNDTSSQNGGDRPGYDSSKIAPKTATKLRDDGKAAILNHVVYVVKGTEASIIGYDANISSFTAPKYVTISGKEYKVTSIGSYAFMNLKILKKVDLSKSEIGTIGAGAFSGCRNLKTIKLNSSKQKKYGKNSFNNVAAKAKCTITAKNTKTYKKFVKKLKKLGLKNASFKLKKS